MVHAARWTATGLILYAAAALGVAEQSDLNSQRRTLAVQLAEQQERFWRSVADGEPPPKTGLRSIFDYALALGESRRHPERLEPLFALGEAAQDKDPNSPGYGNLKWTWRDAGVTDANAVEFCMQSALCLWHRHGDWLPPPARERLRRIMELAVAGCRRHRVPTSYTNIAVLNAANLLGLGECLQRPDALADGQGRLDAFCLWTWQFGVHEYCSPTYYAPDVYGLRFIDAYVKSPRALSQARALLTYFWTDAAANWHPQMKKLTGAHSRSYDYLRGLGSFDSVAVAAGWLPPGSAGGYDMLQALMGRWQPPQTLTAENQRFPRLVRQSWGMTPAETRTAALYDDIVLSTAGGTYGSQDVPLAIDLPGARDAVRGYFLADGREDPYGKIKYETSSARHMKALHLEPFWAAAQRNRDALALVLYRPEDLKIAAATKDSQQAPAGLANLQSHLVLRRGPDGIWVHGKPVQLPSPRRGEASRVSVPVGQSLVLRYGGAAVGVRLVWARRQDGAAVEAALVDDGNSYGAIRFTVEQRSAPATTAAGAALWVRVGSGLHDAAQFDAWRRAFDAAPPADNQVDANQIRLAVQGEEGPLCISVAAPYRSGSATLESAPTRVGLEVNGREVGRPCLENVEPVASQKKRLHLGRPLQAPASGSIRWEAEDGLVFYAMSTAADAAASAGCFVWQAGDADIAHLYGSVVWPLLVEKPGRYYLWARIRAANSQSDSFYLHLLGSNWERPPAQWNLVVGDRWSWQPVNLQRDKFPTPLDLPAGLCLVELRRREPGAKIDQLFLTTEAKEKPTTERE